MAVFTRELGTYAQRLATIARGDAVCTTFIPHQHDPTAREPSDHRDIPTSTTARSARTARTTAVTPGPAAAPP